MAGKVLLAVAGLSLTGAGVGLFMLRRNATAGATGESGDMIHVEAIPDEAGQDDDLWAPDGGRSRGSGIFGASYRRRTAPIDSGAYPDSGYADDADEFYD